VIERARLAFEQFEVMDGLEGDVLLFPDAFVFGDAEIVTEDTHAIRVAFDDHRVMGEADRDRVVVAIKAEERETIGRCRGFPARVEGCSGQLKKSSLIFFEQLLLGDLASAQRTLEIRRAPFGKEGIEFIEVLDLRHRHEVVQPSKLDHPFDDPLLVGPTHLSEMLVEQIVTLQLQKTVGAFA